MSELVTGPYRKLLGRVMGLPDAESERETLPEKHSILKFI